MSPAPAPEEARSAELFSHAASPVARSIVNYTFGSGPDATRPDRVMRPSTAAILIIQHGALFEHVGGTRKTSLPRIALLGPSDQGQIWSTAPNTKFTLVNLAPGASRRLLGMDPRDIVGYSESLYGHNLAASLQEMLANGNRVLHAYLCDVIRSRANRHHNGAWREQAVLNTLQKRRYGDLVKNYADHFGVTSRTLQRTVRASLGLTPKQVLGIERIRNLVILTSGGWTRTLAELAQTAGYFDQSHMRHELLLHNFGRVDELINGDHIVNEA